MTAPDGPTVDVGRLAPALSQQWGGAEVVVEDVHPLSAGASRLSWALTATCDGTPHRLVLQRERGRGLGRGDMVAEAALLRAARAGGVPVPEVVLADAVGDEVGGAFILTELVAGETIPRRILRDPELDRARGGFARQCGEILARIHAIPEDQLPPLAAPDVLGGVEAMLDGTGRSRPAFEIALDWLRRHRPPHRPAALVHGDFRNGNLILGPEGVRAVLDWELAHVGNPIEDLGWLTARPWRFGAAPPVGGMGTVADLLDGYAAAGGATVTRDELYWWQLFACTRWGVMCLEQARVHLSGEHRSVELAVLGRKSAEMEYEVLQMVDNA